MKKTILLVLCTLILLTGCGGKSKVDEATETEQKEVKEETTKTVDKKLLSVDVRIPVGLIEEDGVDLEDTLDEARKTEGINKVTNNNDGTVTLNMTKAKHEEMIKSIKESIDESSEELVSDEENSFIRIETSKDYTNFDVYVDPNKYNTFDMFYDLGFYMQGLLYNSYNGNDNAEIIVKFIDNDTNEVIEEGSSKALTEATDTAPVDKSEVLVTIDQVPYDLTIQEPDSIGNIYGLATYTNNSEYPITGFELTFHKKIENEKTYFMSYDTVMPGETSSNFESSSEASIDDMELIKIFINARNEDGNDVHIEYDVKLDEYEVLEINN